MHRVDSAQGRQSQGRQSQGRQSQGRHQVDFIIGQIEFVIDGLLYKRMCRKQSHFIFECIQKDTDMTG